MHAIIKNLSERSRHTSRPTKNDWLPKRLQRLKHQEEHNTMTPKSFEYQPLETPDVIRLILVKPYEHGPSEEIHCHVVHVRIDQARYNALSYEWGPSVDNDPIIILGGYPTVVRSNLYHALLRLRKPAEYGDFNDDQCIWIDALSIDQSNTLERNHQVQLMGRIYSGAFRVFIWLGPEYVPIKSAWAVIIEQDRYTSTERRDYLVSAYGTILEMCYKTYWNRVWVQQEVYLAKHILILCDRKPMSYENLDDMLGMITRDGGLDTKDVSTKIEQSAANALVTRKRLPLNSSRLVTWLRMACQRGLETSEPRDLIYAMLGISSDCQDGGLEPDYDKPLLDVYLETILFCGLEKPGLENERLQRTLAERLGLSWDYDMKQKIKKINLKWSDAARGLGL